MKHTVRNLGLLGAVGAVTLVLGITGCSSSTPDRTSGQVKSDKATASQVKKALADAPMFKYPDVSANVYKGSVQLSGFVESPEQRDGAAKVASNVKGVSQVVNGIMIKPTPTGRATIRDPLGKETGQIMLDTNAPAPRPLQLEPNQQPAPENK